MAKYLASIFATEKDQVNCPFYFKIGACRHGDDCSRYHIRLISSPTLIFYNMYQAPDPTITPAVDIQDHVDDFFEDVYIELSKYGEIETLNICDNLADHMRGNVYLLFEEEDQAAAALNALRGRFYHGRQIVAYFSHVTDFSEATCWQYEEGSCDKGERCNFMHIKKIREKLRRKLFGRYHSFGSRSRSGSESRSRSPADSCNEWDYERHESRSPEREGSEEYNR